MQTEKRRLMASLFCLYGRRELALRQYEFAEGYHILEVRPARFLFEPVLFFLLQRKKRTVSNFQEKKEGRCEPLSRI